MLTSGLHSDLYVQKARILADPRIAMELLWGSQRPWSQRRAQFFAEREGSVMRLRRGFALAPRERTLVVEDVITTVRPRARCTSWPGRRERMFSAPGSRLLGQPG